MGGCNLKTPSHFGRMCYPNFLCRLDNSGIPSGRIVEVGRHYGYTWLSCAKSTHHQAYYAKARRLSSTWSIQKRAYETLSDLVKQRAIIFWEERKQFFRNSARTLIFLSLQLLQPFEGFPQYTISWLGSLVVGKSNNSSVGYSARFGCWFLLQLLFFYTLKEVMLNVSLFLV